MGTPVVRPPVSDLIFQVYGRPLHPELFDIQARRHIAHANFRLFVDITPTGHVISWDNADVHLTEVTAVCGQDLPIRRRLLDFRLNQERCAKLPCAHGIHYQAIFQVETLPPGLFTHVHREILDDGGKRGLLHRFPPLGRVALPPLGFVTAEFRPGCLFLSSYHTFPREYTVVKTQSLIEWHGRASYSSA